MKEKTIIKKKGVNKMKYDLNKKRSYQNLEDRKIWNEVIIQRIKKAFKEDNKKEGSK